ncbi:hypothetical protein H5410_051831, partial [Solanum commersonii]
IIIINLQPTCKGSKKNTLQTYLKGEKSRASCLVELSEVQPFLEVGVFGWPIKRIVLFNASGLIQLQEVMRKLKQHNIIEVKHTRKYEAYDPFIISQCCKCTMLLIRYEG